MSKRWAIALVVSSIIFGVADIWLGAFFINKTRGSWMEDPTILTVVIAGVFCIGGLSFGAGALEEANTHARAAAAVKPKRKR